MDAGVVLGEAEMILARRGFQDVFLSAESMSFIGTNVALAMYRPGTRNFEDIHRKFQFFSKPKGEGYTAGKVKLNFGQIDSIGQFMFGIAIKEIEAGREFHDFVEDAARGFSELNQSYFDQGGMDNVELREAFEDLRKEAA
ncbi:MAG: hypothetical protein NUV69_00085 [Candidatus Curtissbacteria bacterium]|nr:hypothetical protein [Candidatus Curtissbacteria bacterium]